MSLNRRQVLRAAAGAALLGPAALRSRAHWAGKKVLFFTKSSGFIHSVIMKKGDEPSHADKVMMELGKAHGFDVTCSKDGTLFDPDKVGQWDLFVFETTGDLTTEGADKEPPMSKAGKAAFLDAIKGGKGFVGLHCASDTFHSKGDEIDPYIAMIGGEFSGHGAEQTTALDVTDQGFPGCKSLGTTFEIKDEWYAQRNLADDLHVILAYDTAKLKGKDYERPNFPETWARKHGSGRVFYSSMGHREDVWSNPKFQEIVLGGMSWAAGLVSAEVEPNAKVVTPYYQQMKK